MENVKSVYYYFDMLSNMKLGHSFKDYICPDSIEKYADYLKNEKGCDMVICLSHLGYGEDKDLASQVRNVDLIVGGHTHTLLHKKQLVKNPDGEDVVVVQNWKWGLNMGHLTIDF